MPKVLIADTLKGRGVSFMEPQAMDPEEPLYKFHSGAPPVELYDAALTELLRGLDGQLAESGQEPVALKALLVIAGEFQHRDMGGCQIEWRRNPRFARFLPARRTQAPAIPRLQARKPRRGCRTTFRLSKRGGGRLGATPGCS